MNEERGRAHDLGSGFELTEFLLDEVVGYFVTGPAAPACRSPHGGRCGGLCPTRPYQDRAVWEADGEWPSITLSPSVKCGCGGQHGHVTAGRYENAGGVAA